jgi:hypothetical protein
MIINRQRITFAIASLCLLIGTISPWYHLPPEVLATFDANLNFTYGGKVIAAIFLVFGIVWMIILRSQRRERLLLWGGFFLVLLFPYWSTTWFPEVALIASSYFNHINQVDRHIIINFPDVQSQWKQAISLYKATPQQSTFNFQIFSATFFQMSNWDKYVIEGLGYSNSFFSFIGRGWCLSVVGLFIELVGVYLVFTRSQFSLLIKDIKTVGIFLIVGLIILQISLFTPTFINFQIEKMLAQGNYQQVVEASQISSKFYPHLKGDATFLERWGKASFYGDQPELSLINFARGLEEYRQQNYPEAIHNFQESLTLNRKQFIVRDYLATALINRGVESFNQNNVSSAAEDFKAALTIFPDNVEAAYYLMLAKVVNGQFQESAQIGKRLIEIQRYFQQPSLTLNGQAYLHSAWASFQEGDLNQAWRHYRQSVDKSAWNSLENSQ